MLQGLTFSYAEALTRMEVPVRVVRVVLLVLD
jgi:hypothetical protein